VGIRDIRKCAETKRGKKKEGSLKEENETPGYYRMIGTVYSRNTGKALQILLSW
jgi:hypothetical protein